MLELHRSGIDNGYISRYTQIMGLERRMQETPPCIVP
jgi:hypothetical protein